MTLQDLIAVVMRLPSKDERLGTWTPEMTHR